MSIFKHIAHPAFDEAKGQARSPSSINPKTGKREYFVGALLQAAPAVINMATATPSTGMSGIEGSLTSSIGKMFSAFNPSGKSGSGSAHEYMTGKIANFINENKDQVSKLAELGIKPKDGKGFTGREVENLMGMGIVNNPNDSPEAQRKKQHDWQQTLAAEQAKADIQKNLQENQMKAQQTQQQQQYQPEPQQQQPQQQQPDFWQQFEQRNEQPEPQQQQPQQQQDQQPDYWQPMQQQPQQSYQQQQPQQQQGPQFLVPDHVVGQRINGVMNRAPGIMDRMQQEFQGNGQDYQ